jgi:uncharacterized protein YcaQ
MTPITISQQTARRFILGKQGLWPGRRWRGRRARRKRNAAMKLFDFDYKWEVYVPAPKRRWGYYVLPILYGDDLVARLDPKLDRTTMTLEIKGFWHEEGAPVKDAAFAGALAKGLIWFAEFVEAKRVDVSAIEPARLKRYVKTVIGEELSVSGDQ